MEGVTRNLKVRITRKDRSNLTKAKSFRKGNETLQVGSSTFTNFLAVDEVGTLFTRIDKTVNYNEIVLGVVVKSKAPMFRSTHLAFYEMDLRYRRPGVRSNLDM